MNILIKDIQHNNTICDVLISGNKFLKIGKINSSTIKIDRIIHGNNMAILPAFYNLHCHAAMCLLRGFCEDLPLFAWLDNIWKKEATLTGEDIYNGTRLAILEMIKSGTVFFADMYWFEKDILRACEQMNIRCNIGVTFMDSLPKETINNKLSLLDDYAHYDNELISFAPAPHAIYTCSGELYEKCFNNATKNNLFLQTHLCETQNEIINCKKEHNNLTPVEYLDKLGVLNNKTIAAHLVHITEKDAQILADRQVVAVHNPCSNMKLSSGAFNTPLAKKSKINVCLGTDGCSSNNNLSIIEEMKIATLLAKLAWNSADSLTANEVFDMATINGAKSYGLKAGKIEEGYLADCILVDLNNERLTPSWNLIYDMVYSADSSCIDTVICNGKILMEQHKVDNEEEIIAKARKFLSK